MELDRNDMITFNGFSSPGVREVGTCHDEIESSEFVDGITYNPFSTGIYYQIYFVFGMIVYRIHKISIGMIKDNKQVFTGQWGNFFLDFHSCKI